MSAILKKYIRIVGFWSLWLVVPASLISQNKVSQVWQNDLENLEDSSLHDLLDFSTRKWQELVRSNVDSSLLYAEKATEIAGVLENDSMIFHSLRRVASSYTQQGDFEKARATTEQLYQHLDSNDNYQVFRYYQTIGIIDFYEGNYEAALEHHLASLSAAKDGELLEHVPAALAEISRVFDDMGQPIKALDYAKQDLDFTLQHGGPRSKFIAHYNLANRYSGIDSFTQALSLYNIADSLARDLAVPVYQFAVILGKGSLYENMGQYEQAIALLSKSVEQLEASGNKRGYLTAMHVLGKSYNGNGQYRQAVPILTKAYEGIMDAGLQNLAQSCRQSLAEAMYQTGKGDEAYLLLDKYRVVEDSLKSAETSETINKLEIQYQTAERENELLLSELSLAKKTKERNRILYLAIIFLIGAVLIYFFQKKVIDRNEIIAAREFELQEERISKLENERKILAMTSMIEGQENERSRIAKDLHDGLGVLLSSVRRQVKKVQLEIEKLTEMDLIGDTEKLIGTACEEVRRISHDMMPDALINLGLEEAVRDLAYQIEFDHAIKTHVEISDVNLEDIVQINLYRIIQEFCNNSIKYSEANNLFINIIQSPKFIDIVLRDDGVGFDLEKASKGVGLGSIESRVKFLNGDIKMDTATGVTFDISIPIHSES